MNNTVQSRGRTLILGDKETPILASATFSGSNYYLKPEGLFLVDSDGWITLVVHNKKRVKRAKFGRIGKTKMDYFIGRKQYRLEMHEGMGIIRRVDWSKGGA